MKNFVLLIVGFFPFLSYAQEPKAAFDGHKWEAPYHLSIPANWTIERFLIPIAFAPQIPYKGVEDIRFPPGWGNVKSDEYWSYAFLWYLKGTPKTSSTIIAANLKAYYTGLIAINTDSAKLNAIPQEQRQVKTSFKEMATVKGDLKTFKGTVDMLDFMQLKPITLYCIVHLKACPEEKKTILFYELSPKAYGEKIWLSFDQLWLNFTCKK